MVKNVTFIIIVLLLCSCGKPRKTHLTYDEIYPQGKEIKVCLDKDFVKNNAYSVQTHYWYHCVYIFPIPFVVLGAPFYHGDGVKAYIAFDGNPENPWQEIRWGENIVRSPRQDNESHLAYLMLRGTYNGFITINLKDVDYKLFNDAPIIYKTPNYYSSHPKYIKINWKGQKDYLYYEDGQSTLLNK